MADKYWYYDSGVAADQHWDTVENWWDDAAHTSQAAAIPQDGDYVRMLGATAPNSVPAVAVELSGFDTSGLTATYYETPYNMSIASGGTLIMGDPAAPGNTHRWCGVTAALGTFVFNDSTTNFNGTVGDNATFNDASSSLYGTVGDYATFNDSSRNCGNVGSGIVGDYATFNSDHQQNGTYTGSTYYVQTSVLFDIYGAAFTGTAPIKFILTGTGATLSGVIASDYGTTPVEHWIYPEQPDLAAGNILSGKTILGVDGTLEAKDLNYSEVAAAADVRSGTPRWTGATGADVGTLDVTADNGGKGARMGIGL